MSAKFSSASNLFILLLVLAAIFAATAAKARPPEKEFLDPDEEIPYENPRSNKKYKSWTLFLVCTPDWLAPENDERLRSLYERFGAFGNAIGGEHVALWFGQEISPNEDPDHHLIADHIDIDRSRYFCKQYELSLVNGPHIVYTTIHPDRARGTDETAIIEFNGKDAPEVGACLNVLADLMLQHEIGKYSKPRGKPKWMAIYETFRGFLEDTLSGIKITFKSKYITAELKKEGSDKSMGGKCCLILGEGA
ncbi:MAG: hypothetical protein GY719_05340 [bacterium]|nr:hypothetical protein [bacterium]